MKSMTCSRTIWQFSVIALIFTFCLGIFPPDKQSYAKLVLYSFEEKIRESEPIVIGRVLSVLKWFFGRHSASVQTVKVIKGNFEKEEFRVKYGQFFLFVKEDTTELVENESYVLFLRPDNSDYILVGTKRGYYHIGKSGTVRHAQMEILLEDFIKIISKVVEKQKEKP